MTHYIKIKGLVVKADCGCYYPYEDKIDNTCPLHTGNCESCQYGKAEISLADLFALQDSQLHREQYL